MTGDAASLQFRHTGAVFAGGPVIVFFVQIVYRLGASRASKSKINSNSIGYKIPIHRGHFDAKERQGLIKFIK
jgi:hypothetical protein